MTDTNTFPFAKADRCPVCGRNYVHPRFVQWRGEQFLTWLCNDCGAKWNSETAPEREDEVTDATAEALAAVLAELVEAGNNLAFVAGTALNTRERWVKAAQSLHDCVGDVLSIPFSPDVLRQRAEEE